jgi:hypothetical protein
MHRDAINHIDDAALALVRALDEFGGEIEPYLGPEDRACLACVRQDVARLREALLGAQMGPLYWDDAESPPGSPDMQPPAGPPP